MSARCYRVPVHARPSQAVTARVRFTPFVPCLIEQVFDASKSISKVTVMQPHETKNFYDSKDT
jgi:hypothetical protein